MRQQYLAMNPLDKQLIAFRNLLELGFKHNKMASVHIASRGEGCYPQFIEILH